MLLRVLTAAETLPTSPLLADVMSAADTWSALGEGVAGVGVEADNCLWPLLAASLWWEVVLVGPELELRMTSPAPVPWS